jgi:hypothetical protein
MKSSWRRPVLAAALSLTAVAAGLLAAGPARAQAVESGSLSFSGDPGDYITGGLSYSYSTANGDSFAVSSASNALVSVSVNAYNGDWWYLDIAAPSGQTLVPGTYLDAHRYPFNGTGPGLSLVGNGRGCNTLTGSFTVINAVFGPNNYVQTFDATFEQHCEGLPEAARGEVHIANPPPPPALALQLAVATNGTASTLNGNATVHGTVSCTAPTTVNLSGTIVQVVKRILVRGSFSTQFPCTPGTPVAWTGTAVPTGTAPFEKGDAEVTTQATGYDSQYGNYVTANDTSTVTLTKLK